MAYDFNGTTDYVEAASAVVTTAPVTLAGWFNSDSATANQTIVSITNAAGQERFVLQAAGAVTGDPVRASTVAGNISSFADSATGYSANTWHHAAGVFASSTSRIAYIDGVAGTTETTSRTPGTMNATRIGVTVGGGSRTGYMNGRLAEIAIWNVALNADEIAALAKGYRPSLIRPASLRLYVPLVREVGDYSRAVTLTTSGTTVADHTRRIA
jgi:hypothetical protein